jgi:predicted DsbA family dithiol-disulfide isomerase
MPGIKITYFVEILSSWCLWAEPAWDELKARFGDRAVFDWRIALMNPGDFPKSREECDRYYRRSGTIMRSDFMLRSDWLEPELAGDYRAPNHVAEAGRDFGAEGDSLRRALANAAMLEGKPIGRMDVAVSVGAASLGVSESDLRARAESQEVRQRVEASTAQFLDHKLNQRPSFIIQDAIGDKAVISGLATAAPLIATIEAMLVDTRGYETYRIHHGDPSVG